MCPFCLCFDVNKFFFEFATEILYGSLLTPLKRTLILLLKVKIFSHKSRHLFFFFFLISVQNNVVLCCPCNFDRWLIINLGYCGSDRNLIGYLWTKCENVECRSMLQRRFDISFQRLNPLFWNIWLHTVCFSLVDVYVSRQNHNSTLHEVMKLYQ